MARTIATTKIMRNATPLKPRERPRRSAAEIARSLAACADRLGCASLESLWQRTASVPPERPSSQPPITGVQRAEMAGRRTLKVVR